MLPLAQEAITQHKVVDKMHVCTCTRVCVCAGVHACVLVVAQQSKFL